MILTCRICSGEIRPDDVSCQRCGAALADICPGCGNANPVGSNFCNHCGRSLRNAETLVAPAAAPGLQTPSFAEYEERKHITALYSDISGYTDITTKLEPEEARQITQQIFSEIHRVVSEYGGFVEKHIGDAVVALFGVPNANEDDPFRAVQAARKIHRRISAVVPRFEEQIGQRLSMHTGISTGLMITGTVDVNRGLHGVSGSAISLASRLSDMAPPGHILVEENTFRRTEGAFRFKRLPPPTAAEGWEASAAVYRVVSELKPHRTVHRLSGMRAEMIGRKAELAQLRAAAKRLYGGNGSIITICGEAGTGKSRLVEEFKATLDPGSVEWLDMVSYPYSQNAPYFPLIDFISRMFGIEDSDSPDQVESRLQAGIRKFLGIGDDVPLQLERLYAYDSRGTGKMNPETWKRLLYATCTRFLSALAQKKPIVFCMEDLHWADGSFLELIRHILPGTRLPVLFLCTYRPNFRLFDDDRVGDIHPVLQTLHLHNLEDHQTAVMMESMLKSRDLPETLRRMGHEQTDGNPFYLEEFINSLVDSNTLVWKNQQWHFCKPVAALELPPSVTGVISARIDRLDPDAKRLLREAAVIGRTFSIEILERISGQQPQITGCLKTLIRLDLIKPIPHPTDKSFTFKHSLTQQVAYNGLLSDQRRKIHDRIAQVMETLFQDTLSNYYEILAYHYQRGENQEKAVEFLIKSGLKSLDKYAVEEAHRYYQDAFSMLSPVASQSGPMRDKLLEIIIQWTFVYHYRGDFFGLRKLLTQHETLAVESGDRQMLGMYYTQMGFVLYQTGDVRDAFEHLEKALTIGEAIDDPRIVGYACSTLSWCAPDLGMLKQALDYGQRAVEIYRKHRTEEYIYFNTMGGIGITHWFRGDHRSAQAVGETLLTWSQKHDNVRGCVLGHFVIGCSHFMAGAYARAADAFQAAIDASADPWFSQFPTMMLCFVWITLGDFDRAGETIERVLEFCEKYGTNHIRTLARSILGIVLISRGAMAKGFEMVKAAQQEHLKKDRKFAFAIEEHILGRLFHEIYRGSGPRPPIWRNLGFLLTHWPLAPRIAERHFRTAIDMAEKIGARGLLGQAYLDLGCLKRDRKREKEAGELLAKAVDCFEQCGNDAFADEARSVIGQLNPQPAANA